MNSKKAKALRKIARSASVGKPFVAYRPTTPHLVFNVMDVLRKGRSAMFLGVARLTPDCTRALYQNLKRSS